MKADEIVRALRDAEGNNELDCEISELRPLLLKAAGLIESLQARLVEYDALAAEYGIDGKTMLTLAKSQIETAKENIVLREALEESQRREKAAVEDLNLHGGCVSCKHKTKLSPFSPCKKFRFDTETPYARCSVYEWRGAQKKGAEHE